MNCLILGLHYTNITYDRVCLLYVLITSMDLNIGAIIEYTLSKAQAHKGHMYAFGGIITSTIEKYPLEVTRRT